MCGKEDGHAELAVQPADLLPDGLAAGRIQTFRRLIEEEQARAVDERARQVQPALHPAGISLDLPVGGVDKAQELQQLVAPVSACPGLMPKS